MRGASLYKRERSNRFGVEDLIYEVVDIAYTLGLVFKCSLQVIVLMIVTNLSLDLLSFIISKF